MLEPADPAQAFCVSVAHHPDHDEGCDGSVSAHRSHAQPDGTIAARRCLYDPGVVVAGVREADVSSAVSTALVSELRARGASTILMDLPLGRTIAEIRKLRPVAAIELHCDAGAGETSMVLHAIGAGAGSLRLAEALAVALPRALPWACRGIYPGCPPHTAHPSLGFLERTPCPAAIVELGFLDRESHRLMLTSPATQQALARELAGALIAWGEGQCPLCGVTRRIADHPCSCTEIQEAGSGSSIRA